jgi:hypothetical protein
MASEELRTLFSEVRTVITEAEARPNVLWKRVLDVSGQSSPDLRSLDFEIGSRLATQQLQSIVAFQPLPNNLSFVYFGLFDLVDHGNDPPRSRVGCYFAGGTEFRAGDALDAGELSYFPKKRFLNLDILDRIKELGLSVPARQQLFDHVILFGAAAILAKNAVANIGIRAPLYVGFDSGDYALVSAGSFR